MLGERSSFAFGLAVVGIVGIAVGAIAPWGTDFRVVSGFDADGEWVLGGAALAAFSLDRHGRMPTASAPLWGMVAGSALALAKGIDNLFAFTGSTGVFTDASGDPIAYSIGWGTYVMLASGAVLAAATLLTWGSQKQAP